MQRGITPYGVKLATVFVQEYELGNLMKHTQGKGVWELILFAYII